MKHQKSEIKLEGIGQVLQRAQSAPVIGTVLLKGNRKRADSDAETFTSLQNSFIDHSTPNTGPITPQSPQPIIHTPTITSYSQLFSLLDLRVVRIYLLKYCRKMGRTRLK